MTRPTKVVFGETTLKKHGDFEPEFLKNRLLSGASIMRAEDIRARLRRQPFRPLRICVTDQTTFDLYHPDQAIVLRKTLILFSPAEDAPTVLAEDGIMVSLNHITRLIPLPPKK